MPQNSPTRPKLKENDMPIWHHHHSLKLSVNSYDSGGHVLILKTNAVEVQIRPDTKKDRWIIEYMIRHRTGSWNRGGIYMTKGDLKTAFGLSKDFDENFGREILKDNGGDVAKQGTYIRYRECLNIPGPGTGHDGDPNVSIFVDEWIADAVRLLF